jgi:signal transduction histidine kinase/CheY-like chemotaxis protein
MSDATQLDVLLRYRLDAVALAAAAIFACYFCRRLVRRRRADQEFSPTTCALVAALVVAGTIIAEWFAGSHPFPPDTRALSIVTVRLLLLGGAALLIGVLLVNATLLALMRAEVRQHAETERELQRAKTAADQANRAKGDFLAVISHEIRTPLNAVMGFANLLSETKLDEAQRGYLGTITGEGARLNSLINDILDLSKIEEGRLNLERLPFAPAETCADVLRLLSARALEKKIDLRFEAQLVGPLLISGDPLRFRQILLNLVDNAIKFTPRGSVTLFLNWTPPLPNVAHGTLAVRVRDTGIGIPAEKRATLFQMFVQAEASTTRRFGGTGLGLAICQRLVALMGGEISVQSEVAQGSEFSFAFPATPVALPEEEPSSVSSAPAAPAHPPRILVVDDLETNRRLLEFHLQRHGFTPILATDGQDAVQLAQANRFDAILLDLQMPDLDGFAVTQRIRAAETNGHRTPIIALTASIAKGTREKCFAAGMDEHLVKPLDLKKLKALLENTLAPTVPTPPATLAAPVPAAPQPVRR